MADLVAAKLNTSTDPQVGFRPAGTLDATRALDRYAGPFGPRQAAHLARRSGFGTTPAEVASLASLGVDRAVDARLHPAEAEPDFPGYPAPGRAEFGRQLLLLHAFRSSGLIRYRAPRLYSK